MTDISFSKYRKNDIHGVSLYPATMIAPVQHIIMEKIFSEDNIGSVYDPYHGSGTALFEAAKLNKDCNIIGCDINPLANLMTYIKLKGVTKKIEDDIQLLYRFIDEAPSYDFEFSNINKWFKPDIIYSLKKIKWAIGKISSKRNRSFFWIVFSNIIRRYSNTRSSTYKLHIRKIFDIDNLNDNVIRDFKSQVDKGYSKFNLKIKNVTLLKGDVLEMSKKIADRSIDLTITLSPFPHAFNLSQYQGLFQ